MARNSTRDRFGFRLGPGARDRVIADWIDVKQLEGVDVSEVLKNWMYEMITGTSSLTGRALGAIVANVGLPVETIEDETQTRTYQAYSKFDD